MLISMTGHGDATLRTEHCTVTVELRSVNNRHFKFSLRGVDGQPHLESRIEDIVRQRIHRGTVYADLRFELRDLSAEVRINRPVLEAYRRELTEIFGEPQVASLEVGALLQLPGVLPEVTSAVVPSERDWPVIEAALTEALEQLNSMRLREGAAMERDLRTNCELLLSDLTRIRDRAPHVLDGYRTRLIERVNQFLSPQGLSLTPADVIKEVALFTDRGDVSEELVRLRAHVEHVLASLEEGASVGRKLDFLTQEMFREANTIGSKANDAEIAHVVVEMKNRIERLREMVQNVE